MWMRWLSEGRQVTQGGGLVAWGTSRLIEGFELSVPADFPRAGRGWGLSLIANGHRFSQSVLPVS